MFKLRKRVKELETQKIHTDYKIRDLEKKIYDLEINKKDK